jgi:hypothetical protein
MQTQVKRVPNSKQLLVAWEEFLWGSQTEILAALPVDTFWPVG